MQKTSSRDNWVKLILGLSLFLGLLLRLLPVLLAGFPINDGGMFLVMIRDLRANGLLLPTFTTYNLSNIPYVYPPLGFYIAAVLSYLGISEMELLHWLPAIINIASIYAVYLLSSAILNDRPRGALTAAVYALMPGGYGWFIMGGGLTRALGGLFLVLSVYMLLRVFQGGERKEVALAALFCTLTVLSHPEEGLHAAASCALAWAFYGRTRRGVMQAAAVTLGTLVLTSPWWLAVLVGHGLDPFVSVFYSGMYVNSPLKSLFLDVFARGSLIPVLLILRVAGIAWAVWKRQFFLIAWMALPYFVEPRSAPAVSFYPFTMLIALGLADALPALVNRFRRKDGSAQLPLAWIEQRWMNLTVLTLLFYLFLESSFSSFPLVNTTLKSPAIQAMQWVRGNVPIESSFLILRGEAGAMVDPVQEWFPALASRRSKTTLQGQEWTLAEGFMPRVYDLYALQDCQSVECIEMWSTQTGLDFTHLLVEKSRVGEALLSSIASDPNYVMIYENPQFVVFSKDGTH